MIKAKKIGLILDKEVQVDAILKGGMTIGVTCELLDADYDRLYLKFPDDKEQLHQYFYEGREVEVSLDTLEGHCTYLGFVIYEPEDSIIVVEYCDAAKKEQNRRLLRVRATRVFELQIGEKHLSTLTIDLSGGGCRLLAQEEVKAGTIADALLRLNPNLPPIKMKIRVISSRYFSVENKYEISVEFIGIKESDRKQITKFCFDTQSASLNGKNRIG